VVPSNLGGFATRVPVPVFWHDPRSGRASTSLNRVWTSRHVASTRACLPSLHLELDHEADFFVKVFLRICYFLAEFSGPRIEGRF
jgi:hypothetical protein